MAGGIGYVVDSLSKRGKSGNASKGEYSGTLVTGRDGSYRILEIVHYGTLILRVDWRRKMVSGGYDSVSSSQAINKALGKFGVPCYWSRAEKQRGFWCRDGWNGSPDGQRTVDALLKARERAKMERQRTSRTYATLAPNSARVPGHRYSPYAKKRMAEIHAEILKTRYGTQSLADTYGYYENEPARTLPTGCIFGKRSPSLYRKMRNSPLFRPYTIVGTGIVQGVAQRTEDGVLVPVVRLHHLGHHLEE